MDTALYHYLRDLMPDAPMPEVECAGGCGLSVPIVSAAEREGKIYCSDVCADRSMARLAKPQPKGPRIEGFDV